MAQLAIKGHATRGREVIELLEMLGGKNDNHCCGGFIYRIYFINENGYIESCDRMHHLDYFQLSLEEFLEKFPYKVGDKVLMNDIPKTIKGMNWNSDSNEIVYKVETNVRGFSEEYHVFAYDIQPYKEETMEEQNKKSVNHVYRVYENEVISFDIAQKDQYELDLKGKFEVKLRDGKYFVERIKPQYPKTYEECWYNILKHNINNDKVTGYKNNILSSFQKLLICRDAYWKIAGKQMGLGESWEPNWLHTEQDKFVLYTHNYVICSNRFVLGHNVLAFPTTEMRDAFFENFKDLIEDCKELL